MYGLNKSFIIFHSFIYFSDLYFTWHTFSDIKNNLFN